MKKIVLVFFLLSLLFSCDKENESGKKVPEIETKFVKVPIEVIE